MPSDRPGETRDIWAEAREREARAIAAARRIPEALYENDMVFWEDGKGNEGYFQSCDEVRDWCDVREIPPPAEVWGCLPKRFAISSPADAAYSLIEQELENGEYHENIEDELTDYDDLVAAIIAWNARQSARSFYPDYGLRVVLDV